jgi:hypothetical protein
MVKVFCDKDTALIGALHVRDITLLEGLIGVSAAFLSCFLLGLRD